MSTKNDREQLLSGNDNAQPPGQEQQSETKKKSSVGRIIRNIFLGILGVCLLAVIGLYVAGVIYFKDRFFFNTSINGFDASQKTVEEVESEVAAQIASYSLKIKERGDDTETITAQDIDYHYVSKGEVQAFKKSQNIFTWPVYIWKSISYVFDSSAQYDEGKLSAAIAGLKCMDDSQATQPKDAYIDFLDGSYLVVAEVEGNLLDHGKTEKTIQDAVDFGNKEVSLENKSCYKIPNKRQNDEILTSTCKELNVLVSTNIVYVFGSNSEVLNADTIRGWISYDDSGNVNLDQDAVAEYVSQLAQKYDTADKGRNFVTHSGETVYVEGGSYGWRIDQESETAELTESIKSGYQGERYAIFSQTAVSWDNSDLGNSYVEIDLGSQHVWFYIDGEEIVSTDCVSGDMAKSGCMTPSGTYTLYYKESPAVLRGENNEYESKVTYWMPFNGGIGLHDATWRSSFGGTIYQTSGSHGCINLPFDAAKQIYENIYEGIPIICYY